MAILLAESYFLLRASRHLPPLRYMYVPQLYQFAFLPLRFFLPAFFVA